MADKTRDYITPPLIVEDVDSVAWADVADVVVVGFGGAGAVAALQAREDGADVLAIDRFDGGGATAYSGGVYYGGGGTRFQHEAGCDDSPDEMFKYLSAESNGVVADDTLMRFCQNNNRDLEWLIAHGAQYNSALALEKTAYPPEGKFLYYSGNERVGRYLNIAKPAPRGHRHVGKGFTGKDFYAALKAGADKAGVRTLTHAPVTRLVVDSSGAVIGVEASVLPPQAQAAHAALYKKVSPLPFFGAKMEAAIQKAQALEDRTAQPKLIRARGGVVLSTGGFAYNLGMLEKHRPLLAQNYRALIRMGSMGCNGSGIRLGQSAGGAVDLMDSTFIARTLAPPNGLLQGVAVDKNGRRFLNEDAYVGFLGEAISRLPDAKAWLILNQASRWNVVKGALTLDWSGFPVYGLPVLLNMLFGGATTANTLEALARKCRIDAKNLEDTIHAHNDAARQGAPDPAGKSSKYVADLSKGPYTALNISIDNGFAFTSVFTLGGLVVDEKDGAVQRGDGVPITGLYAAGRAAIGLCSRGYISGMSIADCVFSGRRAGEAAARRVNAVSGVA